MTGFWITFGARNLTRDKERERWTCAGRDSSNHTSMGTQKTSQKEAKLLWLPGVTIAESHCSKDIQIVMMDIREAWLIQLQLENQIIRCQVGKVTLERWVLSLSWGLSA